MTKPVVICITGASGAVYGEAAVRACRKLGKTVHLIFSATGEKVFSHETGMTPAAFVKSLKAGTALTLERNDDMFSRLASGGTDAAVLVCPCSAGTLGRIAAGLSSTLIERVCDVALKERNRLVCVVRESPLSAVHIRNMAAVTEAGGVVMPASPFFYLRPSSLDQLAEQFVDRILKELIEGYLPRHRWEGHGAL